MFIIYENPRIHLKYTSRFGVNMFCEECSCSNKDALIRPPPWKYADTSGTRPEKDGHCEMI